MISFGGSKSVYLVGGICLDLCMDFHITATSVLKPHQQNALSRSGQNDRPAGGDKFPPLVQSFEHLSNLCRCETGWILLIPLWLIVTGYSGLGQRQYQANIINALLSKNAKHAQWRRLWRALITIKWHFSGRLSRCGTKTAPTGQKGVLCDEQQHQAQEGIQNQSWTAWVWRGPGEMEFQKSLLRSTKPRK